MNKRQIENVGKHHVYLCRANFVGDNIAVENLIYDGSYYILGRHICRDNVGCIHYISGECALDGKKCDARKFRMVLDEISNESEVKDET